MTKNPKLQLCKQHFPLEALSIHQPPNIVPPKGMRRHRLQFWIFYGKEPGLLSRGSQTVETTFPVPELLLELIYCF